MSPTELKKLREGLIYLRKTPLRMKSSAFRSAGLKYANEKDLVSGSGAAYYGGRWNPVGMRAIYASLEPETAVKEAFKVFSGYGFHSYQEIKPRVIAGIRFRCSALLDLTNSANRQKLGISLEDILNEPWEKKQRRGKLALTQLIATETVAAKFEGILTKSAQHRNGTNIVVFPDHLVRGSSVIAMSPSELPPHPTDS